MVHLKDVTQQNFYECMDLERASNMFVGGAADVIAEGYTFRHHSTTYAIYIDDTVVGLVTVSNEPHNGNHHFTNFIIADGFQGKGYAQQAVRAIIDLCIDKKDATGVELQVHEDNAIALHIYKKFGFAVTGKADWSDKFLVINLTF